MLKFYDDLSSIMLPPASLPHPTMKPKACNVAWICLIRQIVLKFLRMHGKTNLASGWSTLSACAWSDLEFGQWNVSANHILIPHCKSDFTIFI